MPDLVESPDLKQLGTDALRDLLNNLTQAKGFILDQAPEFCQQLIAWQVTCGVTLAALAVLVWLVYLGALFVLWRREDFDSHEAMLLVGMFGLFPVLMATIAAFCSGSGALKAWVAPKVFLVEQLTHMLRH